MLPNPTLRHVYASLAELNDSLTTGGATALTNTANNARKVEILDEVSRLIDAKCHRGSGFGPWVGTKEYDTDGGSVLLLGADLAELDDISIASSIAATPETPVVETDFYLAGLGTYEPPYRRVILHGQGTPTAFGCGRRLASVTGTWSFPYRTRTLTVTLAEDADTSETELDVSGLTGLSPAMTILIGDEQMFITAVTDSTTDSITVERGVNGTTAATHLSGAAIVRYVYAPNVHTLTLRLAERRWKARDAGADGLDGGNDVGTVSLREGEDTVIRRMLGAPVMLTGYV